MLDELLSGLTGNAELENLLASLASEQPKQLNPDDADLTPPPEPITKPGDLWLLGEHRLLCGDATDVGAWDLVLQGERPSLCLTDPPYGIGVDYGVFTDTPQNVADLAERWLPLARSYASVVAFTSGVTRQWLYPEPDWVLCWFFGGGQLCGPWGFSCWQPIVVYGKDPSLASGNGRRPDAFDLNVPANAADIDHPVPKPLRLWEELIDRLTFAPDSIIVDCLGGSGTTIIAAERKYRKARLIELSPAYCDVAVRRWERVTGGKAQQVHA
jgi:DNA modification methylase